MSEALLGEARLAAQDYFLWRGHQTYISHGRLLVDLVLEILEDAWVDHLVGFCCWVQMED